MAHANPERRRAIAREAALVRWSREDAREGTRAARAAFLDRFVDEVDPNRTLPLHERLRRAERAKRAYFSALRRRAIDAQANPESPQR